MAEIYKSTKNKNGKTFVSSVLLLSLSTILVKIIGLVYKIPMLSLLGAEGMGYFNSSYEIYALLCLVATTGLPVAISMLVSSAMARSDGNSERRLIFRNALGISFVFGSLVSIGLIVFCEEISRTVGNYNAASCIFAIAPSLLFVCIAGVYRGYFQGMNCMYPTALSQIIEVVGKLVFGVAFAYVAIKKGYGINIAAAFATVGLSLGMMLSMLFLILQKFIKDKRNREDGTPLKNNTSSRNGYFSRLLKISVPITMSSLIMGVTRLMDMTMIFRRLQDIGVDTVSANEMYGAYTTLAMPVFSLIPSLITPISLALVPALSSAIKRNSLNEQTYVAQNALKLTVFFALPASFGISAFAGPLLNILFINQAETVEFVAPLLAILGASVLFSCVITTSNAILHAYMKTGVPIASMICGALVKLISEYFLIGDVRVGIFGAPVSTLLCDLTVAIINLVNVIRLVPSTKNILDSLWRIFVASLGAVSAAIAIYLPLSGNFESELLAVLLAAVIAIFVYIVLAFLVRAIVPEELELFPFGEKISNLFFKKYKIKNFSGWGGKNDG